eukprot:TRINITY_DN18_c0_g1_i2.p1 TRINITY_DN18_c0_g1~~TRINITY_DN18_c0_g1_i2.p1  ORF type:complete len:217 (+),score=70.58 TRINITY_DN18_c0_g1_i2:3-653(+)
MTSSSLKIFTPQPRADSRASWEGLVPTTRVEFGVISSIASNANPKKLANALRNPCSSEDHCTCSLRNTPSNPASPFDPQDFWVCYLELPKPSEMKQQFEKQGFFLCRSECRPEWEHEEVRNGGFWIITISDNQIDETWKHLLIAAIGQRFSNAEIEDDEVVAIQYETQENGKIRIKVWNKRSEKEAALKKQILEVLKPPLKTDLSYYRKFADAGKF